VRGSSLIQGGDLNLISGGNLARSTTTCCTNPKLKHWMSSGNVIPKKLIG
jgi:hypothetical protein